MSIFEKYLFQFSYYSIVGKEEELWANLFYRWHHIPCEDIERKRERKIKHMWMITNIWHEKNFSDIIFQTDRWEMDDTKCNERFIFSLIIDKYDEVSTGENRIPRVWLIRYGNSCFKVSITVKTVLFVNTWIPWWFFRLLWWINFDWNSKYRIQLKQNNVII